MPTYLQLLAETQKKTGVFNFYKSTSNDITNIFSHICDSSNALENAEICQLSIDDSFEILANASLRSLNLEFCNLPPTGAPAIAHVLTTNTFLKTLRLPIETDPQALIFITKALTINKTLITFNLMGIKICDKGATAIAELLTANTPLDSLDLSFTQLSDEGVAIIARALASNSTLEELLLDGNKIGDKGATHIITALKINKTILHIGLFGTDISNEKFAVIMEHLKENRKLKDYHSNPESVHVPQEEFRALRIAKEQLEQANQELMTAAFAGNVQGISLALENGADVNCTGFLDQGTPLQFAAGKGHAEAVELLLDKKADVHKVSRSGNTTLRVATKPLHLGIVQALLAAKADANMPNNEGEVPLMRAASWRHPLVIPIMEALINAKANMDAIDKSGNTALSKAMRMNYPPVVAFLSEKNRKKINQGTVATPNMDQDEDNKQSQSPNECVFL